MTKLEIEIDIAIVKQSDSYVKQEAIIAAAEVAKRYIEKAFLAGRKKGIQDSDDNMRQTAPNFEEWSKENGIV